ncbi:MAG: AAA family ATPase [Eubacteriales bacterium]|nr:AAA family ATPase [Eubacteriales bacterium]
MIIHKISIRRFAGLEDFELKLDSSAHIIRADNEAGKSSLLAFIHAALYGLPNRGNKGDLHQSPRQRYCPWNSTDFFGGSLEFSHFGRRYFIEVEFGKRKSDDRIKFLQSAAHFTDTEALPSDWMQMDSYYESIELGELCVGEYLFAMDEQTFENTVFIAQMSVPLNQDPKHMKSLSDRLANLSSSGDSAMSYQSAERILSENLRKLQSKQRQNSILRQLEEKRANLEKRLDVARSLRASEDAELRSLAELDRQIEATEHRRRTSERSFFELSFITKALVSEQEKEEIQALEKNLEDQHQQLAKRYTFAGEEVQSFFAQYFDEEKTLANQFSQIRYRCKTLSELFEKYCAHIEHSPSPLPLEVEDFDFLQAKDRISMERQTEISEALERAESLQKEIDQLRMIQRQACDALTQELDAERERDALTKQDYRKRRELAHQALQQTRSEIFDLEKRLARARENYEELCRNRSEQEQLIQSKRERIKELRIQLNEQGRGAVWNAEALERSKQTEKERQQRQAQLQAKIERCENDLGENEASLVALKQQRQDSLAAITQLEKKTIRLNLAAIPTLWSQIAIALLALLAAGLSALLLYQVPQFEALISIDAKTRELAISLLFIAALAMTAIFAYRQRKRIRLSQILARVESSHSQLERMRTELGDQEAALDSLREKVDELRHQRATLGIEERSFAEEERQRKSEVERNQSELDALAIQLSAVSFTIDSEREKYRSCERLYQDLKHEASAKQGLVAQRQADYDRIVKEELESEHAAEAKREELMTALEEAKRGLERSEQSEELRRLRQELQETRTHIDVLRDDQQRQNRDFKTLLERLGLADEDALKSRLKREQAAFEHLADLRERLRQSGENLSSELIGFDQDYAEFLGRYPMYHVGMEAFSERDWNFDFSSMEEGLPLDSYRSGQSLKADREVESDAYRELIFRFNQGCSERSKAVERLEARAQLDLKAYEKGLEEERLIRERIRSLKQRQAEGVDPERYYRVGVERGYYLEADNGVDQFSVRLVGLLSQQTSLEAAEAKLQNLESELLRLGEELRLLGEQRAGKSAEISARYQNSEQEEDLSNALEELLAEIQRREAQAEALELAQHFLDDANVRMKSRFEPILHRRSKRYLQPLTGGRYQDLRIKKNMELAIVDADGYDHDAKYLSGAAYEQLHLSLRLALAETLAEGEALPLLLDDITVQFDERRLAYCLDTLSKLDPSTFSQILLFTCQDRVGEKVEADGLPFALSRIDADRQLEQDLESGL